MQTDHFFPSCCHRKPIRLHYMKSKSGKPLRHMPEGTPARALTATQFERAKTREHHKCPSAGDGAVTPGKAIQRSAEAGATHVRAASSSGRTVATPSGGGRAGRQHVHLPARCPGGKGVNEGGALPGTPCPGFSDALVDAWLLWWPFFVSFSVSEPLHDTATAAGTQRDRTWTHMTSAG